MRCLQEDLVIFDKEVKKIINKKTPEELAFMIDKLLFSYYFATTLDHQNKRFFDSIIHAILFQDTLLSSNELYDTFAQKLLNYLKTNPEQYVPKLLAFYQGKTLLETIIRSCQSQHGKNNNDAVIVEKLQRFLDAKQRKRQQKYNNRRLSHNPSINNSAKAKETISYYPILYKLCFFCDLFI